MKILHLITVLALSMLPLHSPHAQDSNDVKNDVKEVTDFTAGSDITFDTDVEGKAESEFTKLKGAQQLPEEKAEVTIVEDKHAGEYVQPTLQNISKLYWKKNALVESNDTAIDNFMLINECDIYKKFFKDDFEWERIREAGRKMIKENKDSFPYKFKMLIPIDLGRYNMTRKGFSLINKTAFKDLRRIEIGGNSNRTSVCKNDNTIENYPRNLILILNKPFSYDFVELDEHIAQAFIVRQKYAKINRPRELQNKNFDRLAYARMRITFSKYQGETRGSDNFPVAIMFGRLDGIDIFEDPDEKRLLTSVDYK